MSIGRHVPRNLQLNLADPMLGYTYKAQLSQNISNPFYNYLTPEVFPGAQRNQATVTRGSLLRPYPQYGGLTVNNVDDWRSRYQALQLRAQRTYAAGASVLFAYNYNQERNEAFFNDIEEYAGRVFWLGSNNARHRATIAGSYDVPFGKGRKSGSSMHPILNGIVGGWQISGIYTCRSGESLRMPAAEVVGDPQIANPGPQMWFNADAFRVLPGLHSEDQPVSIQRHHRTDHVERGRDRFEVLSNSGSIQTGVPAGGIQRHQFADVGQSESVGRQFSIRAVYSTGAG